MTLKAFVRATRPTVLCVIVLQLQQINELVKLLQSPMVPRLSGSTLTGTLFVNPATATSAARWLCCCMDQRERVSPRQHQIDGNQILRKAFTFNKCFPSNSSRCLWTFHRTVSLSLPLMCRFGVVCSFSSQRSARKNGRTSEVSQLYRPKSFAACTHV